MDPFLASIPTFVKFGNIQPNPYLHLNYLIIDMLCFAGSALRFGMNDYVVKFSWKIELTFISNMMNFVGPSLTAHLAFVFIYTIKKIFY